MTHTNDEQHITMLSGRLNAAMEEQNVSIRDLARATESSYENIRRIVKGTTVPSQHLLRAISDVLGLNKDELSKIAKADKIRQKFGTVPLELSGKKPSLEPVERIWDELSEQQQQAVINMTHGWARQNRMMRA